VSWAHATRYALQGPNSSVAEAQLDPLGQSERRSPVSLSKTCTFFGSVVT
jgi:hypothetical protein